jgi:Flp pilus assembly protein TadG
MSRSRGFGGWLVSRARQYFRKLGERGVTTVEFAILGPVFLLLVLAVFELGYMVFVQSVLDSSARTAARLVRTGQAQASGNAQTYFQTALCNGASSVIGCGNLIYQVQEFASWSATQTALNTPPKRDKNGNLVTVGFTAGNCGQIEAVQVTYNYKFFTPWIAQKLGGSTQSAFLMSTVVFQNEPFCGG